MFKMSSLVEFRIFCGEISVWHKIYIFNDAIYIKNHKMKEKVVWCNFVNGFQSPEGGKSATLHKGNKLSLDPCTLMNYLEEAPCSQLQATQFWLLEPFEEWTSIRIISPLLLCVSPSLSVMTVKQKNKCSNKNNRKYYDCDDGYTILLKSQNYQVGWQKLTW